MSRSLIGKQGGHHLAVATVVERLHDLFEPPSAGVIEYFPQRKAVDIGLRV